MSEPTVVDRLRRLESRVVVGFEKLGVDVKSRHAENIEVDHENQSIRVASPGTSVQAIVNKLPPDAGDELYTVVFDNRIVCVLGRE